MNSKDLAGEIAEGSFDEALANMYGREALIAQRERYSKALERFEELYPGSEEVRIFSAPGRTEVCGNHTDHQRGRVLAAAINLDAVAVVGFHEEGVIRLQSEGYQAELIDLKALQADEAEHGTTAALIRGMAAQFAELGCNIGGFNAYVTSDVLGGSGLSSSAAFEVLVGTILDEYYNDGRAGAVEIAKMGQLAENHYFGKKCGLMDQMVSSVGGFVFIDFADTRKPVIEKHTCDFAAAGISLCITDTKGSHADLTPDYVAVPSEMKAVAACFGKEVLREVPEQEFFAAIGSLRGKVSDRAILRAAHFYGDDARVAKEVEALDAADFQRFFELVKESGNSSARWLQNVYSIKKPEEQGVSLGLMVSEKVLAGRGAYRVHGGGFAGTIQAFVPDELVEEYAAAMESLFGEGCCYRLKIRPVGGVRVM